MTKIQVAFAYREEEAEQLMQNILKEDETFTIVGKAQDGEELRSILRDKSPDILIFQSLSGKVDEQQREREESRKRYQSRKPPRILRDSALEMDVTAFFHELGIPAHIKGYYYLREAVILTVTDAEMSSSMTKTLYPAIARKFGTTPTKVERSIRHAVEVAWDRGNPDTLIRDFGYSVNGSRGKPTNSEFIAMISDKVRLNCRKKEDENEKNSVQAQN